MTSYTEFKGIALDARNKLADSLVNRAMKELNLSREDIILRELRPEDVSLGTPEWTHSLTAATWGNIVASTTIADNRFVGIYGVRYAQTGAQSVSQLKVNRKGADVRYWQIQGVAQTENGILFFDDPVIADQNTTLAITGYPVTTAAAEKLILVGLVAEKVGLLVSK